jgi:drug/metabolite transporter (DMT)-like permease
VARPARVFSTTEGHHAGAFAPADWATFVAVGAIWGTSFFWIEIALRAFAPGVVTWGRVASGALALIMLPGARTPVASADRPRMLAVAALWFAIPWTLFPIAQEHVTSAVAGMLNGSLPILTAVVTSALLRRAPGRVQTAGLVVGATGVAAIASSTAAGGTSQAIGVGMIVAAVICYAFAFTIVVPLQQRYPPVQLMAQVLLVALVMTAPFGLWSIPRSTFTWEAADAVLIVGVVGTGVAFVLMGRLVARVGSTRAAFVTYLVPVVATALGAFVLDEPVAAVDVVGMVLVLAGAVLASRPDARLEAIRRDAAVS